MKLISLSQQGDAEAFARLYACYVGCIIRYVYFRVTDHELAEDITSRIFLKVLEKLDLQIKSQQLRAALQVLTDEQQRVSILKFIDGLTIREIARQLEKRQGAVRSLQMHALQKLSRCPSLQREQFLVSDLTFMSIQSSICDFCVTSSAGTWVGKPAQQRMILCPRPLKSSDTCPV